MQRVYSSQMRGWSGIEMTREVQAPSELNVPELHSHFLVFCLHNTSHQVSCFGGKRYEGAMNKGDFFVQPSGMPSYFAWKTFDECISLSIETNLLRRVAEEACEINPDRVELLAQPRVADRQIESIVLLLDEEMRNENVGGRLYAESLANVLALRLLRNHCGFEIAPPLKQQGGLTKRQLRLVTDYINDNLAEEVCLEDLATLVGLSSFHFSRQFKQSTGYAPHQYVLNQRVKRAQELLHKTNLSLSEIAFACGFAHQSHLSNVFRRTLKTSPAQYRAAFRP